MLTLHPPGIESAIFQRWALNPLSGHWTTDPTRDIPFWQPLLQYLGSQMLHNLWIIVPGLLLQSLPQPTQKNPLGKMECFATHGLQSHCTFICSSRVIVRDGDQLNQWHCRFRVCWKKFYRFSKWKWLINWMQWWQNFPFDHANIIYHAVASQVLHFFIYFCFLSSGLTPVTG